MVALRARFGAMETVIDEEPALVYTSNVAGRREGNRGSVGPHELDGGIAVLAEMAIEGKPVIPSLQRCEGAVA